LKKKLFSEFAASTLLERDRQTIARALRNTPPDGQERGSPRWKMSTIVAAMERHSRANGSDTTTGPNPELQALSRKFDLAFEAMSALPTLEKRRAAARSKLRPLIATMNRLFREHAKATGVADDVVSTRADLLIGDYVHGFEKPCGWSGTACWENLDTDADASA
jgi:hypothetical protein